MLPAASLRDFYMKNSRRLAGLTGDIMNSQMTEVRAPTLPATRAPLPAGVSGWAGIGALAVFGAGTCVAAALSGTPLKGVLVGGALWVAIVGTFSAYMVILGDR